MCNRIRGLKEWSDIPSRLAGKLINFEYNPNVAVFPNQLPYLPPPRTYPEDDRVRLFFGALERHCQTRHPQAVSARAEIARSCLHRMVMAGLDPAIPIVWHGRAPLSGSPGQARR